MTRNEVSGGGARQRTSTAVASALAALLFLIPQAAPASAQGDLTGGLGRFVASQPGKQKTVAGAAPRYVRPPRRRDPKLVAADRLFEAVVRGDGAAVSAALRAGASVNARGSNGCTPLCRRGQKPAGNRGLAGGGG
jgi:hypothetical protein